VALPAPTTSGGRPLLDALKLRCSTRAFSERVLEPQILSDLLWAAFGVNRPDGHRTAPSAVNWQEIDIFAAIGSGLFRYDAAARALERVHDQDIRAATGMQDFVARVPLNLVYVADFAKMVGAPPEQQYFYSAADAGFIAQNVYLFCASFGLATVVRGLIDRAALARAMRLDPNQHIILAQSVGYPSE
jgi:SagB-type dehydrogenase family enzyme